MEKIQYKRIVDKLNLFNNMKSLTLYIIINVFYVVGASFLATVKKITYADMAKGFIPLLILNVIFSIISITKKNYKKDWVHLCIVLILLFRSGFQYFCNKYSNCYMGN